MAKKVWVKRTTRVDVFIGTKKVVNKKVGGAKVVLPKKKIQLEIA